MNEADVKKTAFAMPLTSPAFPPGPYRFVNREYFIITYRTDPDALRAVIPAPLEMTEPIVKDEFIRMPDSTGFGDYTESARQAEGRDGHGSRPAAQAGVLMSWKIAAMPKQTHGGRE